MAARSPEEKPITADTDAKVLKPDSFANTDEWDVDQLYRYDRVAEGVHGFDAITDEHIQTFYDVGYLVVHDAFSSQDVDDSINGLLDLIEGKNPDYKKGVQLEAAAKQLPREQRTDAVRKLWYYVDYDERLKAMATHSKLIETLSRIMGQEPSLWADQALLKPPRIGREKPWHQDLAYFNLPPDTMVVGAWIALDEATAENGCMHVIPGSHRKGPVVHFRRRDWQICDTDVAVAEDVIVPLKPGGCLLFHGLIHHGTPPNYSDKRRRALQFHYFPSDIPKISNEERMAIFGSEGKDVTC